MKLSIELLNALGLILPGLMALELYDRTSSNDERKLHEQIILSLIFSYIIYLIVGLLFATWEPLITFNDNSGSISMGLSSNRDQIITVLALTLAIPLVFSWCKYKDIPMKWLRWLKITRKSSISNTWADTFHNEDRIIEIYLKDERRIRGWPHRYSSDPKDGFIYLANPVWINTDKEDDDDDDYIETNAHGILFSREEIDFIEFSLKKDETPESISEGDWNEQE